MGNKVTSKNDKQQESLVWTFAEPVVSAIQSLDWIHIGKVSIIAVPAVIVAGFGLCLASSSIVVPIVSTAYGAVTGLVGAVGAPIQTIQVAGSKIFSVATSQPVKVLFSVAAGQTVKVVTDKVLLDDDSSFDILDRSHIVQSSDFGYVGRFSKNGQRVIDNKSGINYGMNAFKEACAKGKFGEDQSCQSILKNVQIIKDQNIGQTKAELFRADKELFSWDNISSYLNAGNGLGIVASLISYCAYEVIAPLTIVGGLSLAAYLYSQTSDDATVEG